jgi:meiosis-specific serine/threonine-protein kinase MEK1
MSIEMDQDITRPPQEIPAAYLHLVDTRSNNQSQQLYPVYERQIFKIGRDIRSNTLTIDDNLEMTVSRNHCEVYVVVYEPTINHIYVRDRKSSNGTLVNGKAIGSGPDISPGYLLQHGDVIEIRPY